MELWIPATIVAALLQTWRTALQQKLRDTLSVNAAGFVRYLYALPTGLLLVAGFHVATGAALPVPGARSCCYAPRPGCCRSSVPTC